MGLAIAAGWIRFWGSWKFHRKGEHAFALWLVLAVSVLALSAVARGDEVVLRNGDYD